MTGVQPHASCRRYRPDEADNKRKGGSALTIVIGFAVAIGCLLGGFAAMGGHIAVIWQPWEYVIIGGSALGIFIFANPMSTIKDAGKATLEAIKNAMPRQRDYLDVLAHKDLTSLIYDYVRLYMIGNARTHEIEALMDEEIQTLSHDKLKFYTALSGIADGLPALGIVAAVLGVIKAMGALDQSPDILGKLIGAALVGTFAGIFLSYGVVGPLANKIKIARMKQVRLHIVNARFHREIVKEIVKDILVEIYNFVPKNDIIRNPLSANLHTGSKKTTPGAGH